MIYIKKILKNFIIFLSLISINTYGINLTDEDYNKIENTFISYALSKGENVIKIDIFDYRKLTDEEKINILDLKDKNSDKGINELFDDILNNDWSNNNMIYNQGVNSVFLYPKKLKPNSFRSNLCNYIILISDMTSCLKNFIGVKDNLNYIMNNNGIYLDDNYIADFLYIHELSHLIPAQRVLPEYDKTNVWVDNKLIHFGEMYSDLFSIIFLNNYLGYDDKKIEDVITLRNFKLFSSEDLLHYSVPYINYLQNDTEWKNLKSFEEIDDFIRNLYINVSNEKTISKKEHKDVYYEYENFCKNFSFIGLESRNAFDLLKKHCFNAIN